LLRTRCSGAGRAVLESISTAVLVFIYLVYPGLSSLFFRAFNCKAIDGQNYLVADFGIRCDDGVHLGMQYLAAALVAAWGIGVPVLFVVVLYPSRRDIARRAITPQLKRLAFFFMDYREDCWFFEAIECTKKVVVTGFAAVVLKASMLQLVLAVFFMVLYTHLVSSWQPYRKRIDNALAVAANALLTGTLFGAVLLKYSTMTALASFTGSAAEQVQGYNTGSIGVLLVVSAVLVLVLCGLGMAWGTRQSLQRLVYRYTSDSTEIFLPEPAEGGFHLFLSHQQVCHSSTHHTTRMHHTNSLWFCRLSTFLSSGVIQQLFGQDQVEVMKYRLESLVPTIRIFIDTDLSNTGRGLQDVSELDGFVANTELVVFFLTRGYFQR
jgi:hypothetical protein